MSFDWDEETVLLLIQQFRKYEMLWNPRNPDYKKRCKRVDALKIIATLFERDTTEIERKLKNLTSHYFREKKKYEETLKSGASAEDVREPKWFAYKPLHFLRDKNRSSEATNSESTSITESEDQPTGTPRKRRYTDEGNHISEAIKVLKDVSASNSSRDDASLFGEYIASKIRKMDPITTSTVQHHIQNIIYQAEMGVHSQRPSSIPVYPGYYTAKFGNSSPTTRQSHYPRSSNDSSNSDTKDNLHTILEED